MRALIRRFGLAPSVGLGWPLVLGAVAATASILLLALSGWFLTRAAIAGTAGGAAVAAFNYLMPSAGIRALAVARTGARYGERLTSHGAALGAMADMRARLFGHLAAADPRDTPDLASGEAAARLIHDIEAVEAAIVRRSAWPAAILAAMIAAVLIALAGWAALITAALGMALGLSVLIAAARRFTTPAARAVAIAQGTVRDRYTEYALARPEIITYGLTHRVVAMLSRELASLHAAQLRWVRIEAALTAMITLLNVIVAASVLVLSTASPALTALAVLAAFAAAETVGEAARAMIRNAPITTAFARLSALYPDTPALADHPCRGARAAVLSIGDATLAPGERLTITGASGSGKTTLLESLAGIRAPDHVRLPLAVDGVALRNLSAATLRAQCALAPQSPQLMAGTVADNLRLARTGVDDAAMWAVLDVAGLTDRVRAMPDGLNNYIGEAGGTLSGGEQKRLSLARALLAERPWLLLDEPTEGLDAATEAALVTRLDAWAEAHGLGIVLVSHRSLPRRLCKPSVSIE